MGHICSCWAFMPNPSPTPQTRLDDCIQNFSRVSTVMGGGEGGSEGEVQYIFRKVALLYEGTLNLQKFTNTALLSQSLLSRVVVVQKFRVAYHEIYPRSNLIFLSVHSFIYKTFKSIVGCSRYTKRKHCMTTVEPHVRPHLPCDHPTKTPKCSQSNPCNQNLSLKQPPHRSDRDHFFLA